MAAVGRRSFSNSSPRFASSMALGLPTRMASVSLASAPALSPSSNASAAWPLQAFCLSSSSSVSSLDMVASSGKPGGTSSSGAIASGSSESSPRSSSCSVGPFTKRLTMPPSCMPSMSESLQRSSSAVSPPLGFMVCQEVCAATSIAMRCLSMLMVACGSICTVTVSFWTHLFFGAGASPRSSSTILTLTFHCTSDMCPRQLLKRWAKKGCVISTACAKMATA
mmetsp:Transcript_5597/g.12692  ORF Transcript_5597/g.12692 Transcript_5597/m.12692 type:complete len:223 (-) Transcript_5597:2-670(-)